MSRRSDPNATFSEDGPAPLATLPEAARFRIEVELGRGGLGRVLRGFDTHLERVVALKTLLHTSPAARARFERETRLTARLQHPNVVPVYDGGVDDDGAPFFAMRLVEGRTLGAEIAARPTLEARLGLLPQVMAACNAVAYAHHERVAHRDLKPDNILVGAFGETLVIDWGLAKDLDLVEEPTADESSPVGSGSLTRVGSVVGTPTYMPPEQAAGLAVGPPADVYSLGAVLYHLLAGHPPYDGAPDVLGSVQTGPPEPVEVLVPGTPTDLAAIVNKAMDRDPARRYSDAGGLAQDLERFAAGRFVEAREYTRLERLTRFVREHHLAVGGVAVVLVALVAGMVGLERARTAAVEGRRQERVARDHALVAEARAVAERSPADALERLASLSADAPMDGAVRTVAATALAAGPSRTLAPPRPGARAFGAVEWQGQLAVAWNDGIYVYTGVVPRLIRPLVDGTSWLVVSGPDLAWCEDDAVRILGADGLPPSSHPVSRCPRIHAAPDGGFLWLEGAGVAGVDGRGAPITMPIEGRVDAIFPSSGGTVWAIDRDVGRVGALDADGGIWAELTLESVFSAAADPSGRTLVVGGRRPNLVSYTLEDGRVTSRDISLDGPTWLQPSLFLPARHPSDPGTLAIGGELAELYFVDLADGATRRVPLASPPRKLRVVGDGVAAALDSGAVDLVDPRTGERHAVQGTADAVRHMVAVDDALFLASSSEVVTARPTAWDREVARVDGEVRTLVWTTEGLWIGHSGGLTLLPPAGPAELRSDHPALRIVSCGDQLWAVGDDGVVFDPRDPTRQIHLEPRVTDLVCSPGGETLAAVASAGRLTWLDGATGEVRGSVDREIGRLTEPLAFLPDGQMFLGGIQAWRVDPVTGEATEIPGPRVVVSVAASGDHAYAATKSGELWRVAPDVARVGRHPDYWVSLDILDGAPVMADTEGVAFWGDRPLHGHSQYVGSIEGRPGGRWVATGSWDKTIVLWDLSTDPPAGRALRGHSAEVNTVVWSADGATLYSGDASGVVRAWSDPLPEGGEALRSAIAAAATEFGGPADHRE